jgi:Trypsin-co-occurring domain 1
MNDAGDIDDVVQTVTAKLPSGVAVRVEAVADRDSGDGMTSAGLKDLDLSTALDSVGEIGSLIVSKLRQARPSKTTVELKLGFAVESGKLTALWVGGKGEASLTVTLEWAGHPEADGGPPPGAAGSTQPDGAGSGSESGDG